MPRFWVSREYIEKLKTPGDDHRVQIAEACVNHIIEAMECTLFFQRPEEIFAVRVPVEEITINPACVEEYPEAKA